LLPVRNLGLDESKFLDPKADLKKNMAAVTSSYSIKLLDKFYPRNVGCLPTAHMQGGVAAESDKLKSSSERTLGKQPHTLRTSILYISNY